MMFTRTKTKGFLTNFAIFRIDKVFWVNNGESFREEIRISEISACGYRRSWKGTNRRTRLGEWVDHFSGPIGFIIKNNEVLIIVFSNFVKLYFYAFYLIL